jgi:hypothetical protein
MGTPPLPNGAPQARVPLIRFVEVSSGVQVDLVPGSGSEDVKAWLVAQAAELQPAFSPLFRLVRERRSGAGDHKGKHAKYGVYGCHRAQGKDPRP